MLRSSEERGMEATRCPRYQSCPIACLIIIAFRMNLRQKWRLQSCICSFWQYWIIVSDVAVVIVMFIIVVIMVGNWNCLKYRTQLHVRVHKLRTWYNCGASGINLIQKDTWSTNTSLASGMVLMVSISVLTYSCGRMLKLGFKSNCK